MAISKTLTPTGESINIPGRTDAPDMNVTQDCIGKEADAINELDTNLGDPSSASAVTGANAFSKINSLNSNLSKLMDGNPLPANSSLLDAPVGTWSYLSTSNLSNTPCANGLVTVYKSSSATNWKCIIVDDPVHPGDIYRNIYAGGWKGWESFALNSKVTKIHDTVSVSNGYATISNPAIKTTSAITVQIHRNGNTGYGWEYLAAYPQCANDGSASITIRTFDKTLYTGSVEISMIIVN